MSRIKFTEPKKSQSPHLQNKTGLLHWGSLNVPPRFHIFQNRL
jgi:hypothetical protein